MEVIFDILFSFLGEIVIQLFGELLVEFGLQSIRETTENRNQRNPWLAGVGHFLLGLIAGGLSLLVLQRSLFHNHILRIVNLFVTPIIAGLCMAGIGRWRRKCGQDTIRLDTFIHGFVFAFAMALIRFAFAN